MILLDTQTVLWLAESPDRLSQAAMNAISSARELDGLAIADKTLWELAMLISRERLKVRTSTAEFLAEVERYCTVLPISGAIAVRAVQFSDRYPRDPSDRLIGATALVHGLKLVTSDREIRRSGEVECVW